MSQLRLFIERRGKPYIDVFMPHEDKNKWVTAQEWNASEWLHSGFSPIAVEYDPESNTVEIGGGPEPLQDICLPDSGNLATILSDAIAPPRGLPKDLCKEVHLANEFQIVKAEQQRKFTRRGQLLHGHSWFTLAELKTVDWNKYDGQAEIFAGIIPYLEGIEKPDAVRIVLWFID